MGILDTVIDKTKELKSEYDQRKRAEKEDWLNIKEENLPGGQDARLSGKKERQPGELRRPGRD